jgi:hypothetical protein
MKKIYICGKVTGDPNYHEKFRAEEDRLESLGYWSVNPTAVIPVDTEWRHAMRIAVRSMLLCDGISLLPDWKKSKGAKLEVRLARKLGIERRNNNKWD